MKKLLTGAAFGVIVALWAVLAVAETVILALAPDRPMRVPRAQAGYQDLISLAPFENVVATGIATARFDSLLGRTVDRIILNLGGTALTKAMLDSVRVLANEKPILDDTGTRINNRSVYRGETADAAFLILDFAEIRAHDNRDKWAGSLDTLSSGIKKLTCEVTITGATAPALSAQALTRPSPQSASALYNRLVAKAVAKTITYAAAAEQAFPMNFVRDPASLIKRVHLFGSVVTAARIKKTWTNGATAEIFNSTKTRSNFILTDYGRTPQTDVMTIDFMPDGDVRGALPLGDALAMEWYLTTSGAGTVTIVPELVEPLAAN